MAKRVQLTDYCGAVFREKTIERGGVRGKAMVCSGCGRVTFSEAQSHRFLKARLFNARFQVARKIIRIGNSIGVTLPEGLAKLGQKVHFVQQDARRLELRIGAAPSSYKIHLEGAATARKVIR